MTLALGKLPVKHDIRNLQMADILLDKRAPEEYDFDAIRPGIPIPMFANDKHGDCVIAGRAHQTLRFECAEQKRILTITDEEVLREWKKENGNTEDGLYMLDSLRLWRKGWIAAGRKYKISAFAEVPAHNLNLVKSTIYGKIGIVLGMALPDTWYDEFRAGKPWSDCSAEPNPQNGHCVYVPAYNKTGPVCVTWARRQQMTWEFFTKYTDEAYGIIDARNLKSIDIDALLRFFENLGKQESG